MPSMSMSHFEATIIFAFLISVVMGVTSRKTDRDRLRYGLKCFGYFLLTVFAVGWIMHFAHG